MSNGINDSAILAAAEDETVFEGASTIAAFIMEPVLGARGVYVPHAALMPGMREICDRHGILMIADEVLTKQQPETLHRHPALRTTPAHLSFAER